MANRAGQGKNNELSGGKYPTYPSGVMHNMVFWPDLMPSGQI